MSDVSVERIWWLYVVRREDGALYTGITLDVSRRLQEHLAGRGAKALRGRSLLLCYQVEIGERSLALRTELRFKKLRKAFKEQIVEEQTSTEALLDLLGLP